MDRAQAHTAEALAAGLLVVSSLVFALQATAVTPLSASTSNQHIETQGETVAEDVLAATAADGSLRAAVLHWNNTSSTYVGAPENGRFVAGGPPNALGAALNESFRDRRWAFNAYVRYRKPDNSSRVRGLVYMGAPSDNAATATRVVPVYDDTRLSGPGSPTLANSTFYAPDADPDGPLYNVLEVRIVVWRM